MTIQSMPLLAGKVVAGNVADNAVAAAVLHGAADMRTFLLGAIADWSAAPAAAFKTITFKKGGSRNPSDKLKAHTMHAGLISQSTLARGSTDTKVSTTAFIFWGGGAQPEAKAAVTAGHTLPTGTIPADKWGLYLVSIAAGGTVTLQAAAGNTTGYDTEAEAIAAMPEEAKDNAVVGYFTVLTASGQPFIAGTDALEGGSSGNPSADTNYYSAALVQQSWFTVRIDPASLSPHNVPLPGVPHGELSEGITAEITASGTGSVTGQLKLFGFTN